MRSSLIQITNNCLVYNYNYLMFQRNECVWQRPTKRLHISSELVMPYNINMKKTHGFQSETSLVEFRHSIILKMPLLVFAKSSVAILYIRGTRAELFFLITSLAVKMTEFSPAWELILVYTRNKTFMKNSSPVTSSLKCMTGS